MAYKIKKGDDVYVLSGKDKGKTGKVLKTFQFMGISCRLPKRDQCFWRDSKAF